MDKPELSHQLAQAPQQGQTILYRKEAYYLAAKRKSNPGLNVRIRKFNPGIHTSIGLYIRDTNNSQENNVLFKLTYRGNEYFISNNIPFTLIDRCTDLEYNLELYLEPLVHNSAKGVFSLNFCYNQIDGQWDNAFSMTIHFDIIYLVVVNERTMRKYINPLKQACDQETTTNTDTDKLLREYQSLLQDHQALKQGHQLLLQDHQSLIQGHQAGNQENQALKASYIACYNMLHDFGVPVIPVPMGYSIAPTPRGGPTSSAPTTSKNPGTSTRGCSFIENPVKAYPVKENPVKEYPVKEYLVKVSMLHYIRDTWVDTSPKGAAGNIFVGGSSEKHHYKDGDKMRIRIYNLHHFPIQFIVYQKNLQGPYERVTVNGVKLASAPNNLFGAKGKLLAPSQDVFLRDCKITDNTDMCTNEFIIEVWAESKDPNAYIQFSRTAIISRDSCTLNLLDSNDSELASPKSPLSIKEETPLSAYSSYESPKASPSCKWLNNTRKEQQQQQQSVKLYKVLSSDTASKQEESEKYSEIMAQLRDDYSEVLKTFGLDAEEILRQEVKKYQGDLKECSNSIAILIGTKIDAKKSKIS